MKCNKILEKMQEEICPDFKFCTFLSEKKKIVYTPKEKKIRSVIWFDKFLERLFLVRSCLKI